MKKVISFVLVAVFLMASTVTASAAEAVADGYTRYEGENANIVGSNAPNGLGTDTGDQFSNGAAAGYLDVSRAKLADLDATFSNTAHVEFTVKADAAGTAEVIVGYTCSDDAVSFAVKANDGAPVEVPFVAADGKSKVTLDLKKGDNTIYVSTTLLDDAGVQHGWCNIDYIDVPAVAAVAETAAAGDTATTDVPKTGESFVSLLFAIAGAGCLAAALTVHKKLRKNVLN